MARKGLIRKAFGCKAGSILVLSVAVVAPMSVQSQELEEIIVTAQKREQNLQSVPISITAFTQAEIVRLGTQDFRDLSDYIPNVAMPGLASNIDASLSIRGISSDTRNTGFDSGASMYVDGVFVGRSSAFITDSGDVEVFELLRGPQGTLFGKNTIAGALNVTTRNPGDQAEGSIEVQAGNFNLRRLRGWLGGPLNSDETVSASIAAMVADRDGFQSNVSDGRDFWALDNHGARGKLRFAPNDRLDILLSADAFRDQSRFNQMTPIFGLGAGCCADNPRNTDIDATGEIDRNFSGGALQIEYTLGNRGVITSITGHRNNERRFVSDDDSTSQPILETTFDDREDQLTQELRYSSTAAGGIWYVVGLYYFDQEVTSDRESHTGVVGPDCPQCFAPIPFQITLDSLINTRAWALFGQVDWNLGDRSVLTVGLRYTDEQRDLDLFNLQGLPPFGIISLDTTDSISDTDPSWTIALSHNFSERSMGYLKTSRGFKSGGFNADYVGSPELRFKPEYATTIEGGIKLQRLNDRLRLNTAVFHTDYQDLQVSIFNPDDLSGFSIRNAAEATIYGLELELTARPGDAFDISAGVGYQKAEFDEFPDAGGPGVDFRGNRLADAPEVTGNLGAQYTWELPGGARIYVRGDFIHSGDYFVRNDNDALSFVDSYNFANARVGFESSEGNWVVELWGRNVGDDVYIVGKDRPLGGLFGQDAAVYGQPRTYGVRMVAQF
jgi:iron complex outermembrane receptor protein